jgi:ATP-dependent Clp protease ATP-binding subunit ClpA
MRKFFTSTGFSENDELEEDPTITDPDQEQEVVNNQNRENNIHWDYIDTANREKPKIQDNIINVIIIGDAGVGKTALVERFVNGTFDANASSET